MRLMAMWMMALGLFVVACGTPLREQCGRGLNSGSVDETYALLEADYQATYWSGVGDDAVWYATSFFEHKWCEGGECGGDPPVCTCETYHNDETGDEHVRECQLFLDDSDMQDYVMYLADVVSED